MLSKILGTATLIVVAWLSVQVLYTQRAVEAAQLSFDQALEKVHAEQSDAAKQNEALAADVMQRMEQLSIEQAAQAKLAKAASQPDPKLLKAKDSAIAKLTQTASLQDAVLKVLKANLQSTEEKGEQAAKTLLSTKSSIWKLSGKLSKSKDALRDLMAPIDILAAKWKRGDYSGNSKTILKVLEDVLSVQIKS